MSRSNGSQRALVPVVRFGTVLLVAAALLIPISGYAARSDSNVRSAVEVLLGRQWQQIGTISGESRAVIAGRQTTADEIRSTVHLTGWTNGEATVRPDGLWEAQVTYQVEFTSGGQLSRYGSTATAVLRHDDALSWAAIHLDGLQTKGGIVASR
jgi:hypothetical protein